VGDGIDGGFGSPTLERQLSVQLPQRTIVVILRDLGMFRDIIHSLTMFAPRGSTVTVVACDKPEVCD
jgi:hypothetical protein